MVLSIIENVSQFKSDYLDMALPVLINGEISELSLKRYLGKYVVILFYPMDFSPMPREEILECMNKFEDFKFANSQVRELRLEKEMEQIDLYLHIAWS